MLLLLLAFAAAAALVVIPPAAAHQHSAPKGPDDLLAYALADEHMPYRDLVRRQAAGANIDVTVLQFALLLEQLESTFYQQGLAKFDANAFTAAGIPAAVRNQMEIIMADEQAHVTFLQAAITGLQGTPNQPCTFNFDAALASVQTFLAFSSVLERTGVEAYDGAVHLLTNPTVKTAGAAIATVEGRHSSFTNLLTVANGAPGVFDTPLSVRSIVSIAAPLITSCPAGVLNVGGAAAIVPFPAITIPLNNANQPLTTGQLIPLLFTPLAPVADVNALFCDWVFGLQQTRTPVQAVPIGQNAAAGNSQFNLQAIAAAAGKASGVVLRRRSSSNNDDPDSAAAALEGNREGASPVRLRKRQTAATTVPMCLIPQDVMLFSQVVLFVVNADRDVTLDDDQNVVAGPLTVNLVPPPVAA
ncbi:ferritin-like domain-containing protein [Zopfochytrium polystomum]|nr:ferritin-like domain-containing protein [Zopfochytrium polystomum]